MDLNELQSVRDRERQTDKLQQLRESFYADAGSFIQQLRAERDRAVERADDPFDSPEVQQLTDEIKTAQQTVEATYEKRVGKIVKAASFAAADLPTAVDGMTAEEQTLFDELVDNIKSNREHVLTLLDGEDPTDAVSTESSPAGPADAGGTSPETTSQEPAGSNDTTAHPPEEHPSPSRPSVDADDGENYQHDTIDDEPTNKRPEEDELRGSTSASVSAADVMGNGSETRPDDRSPGGGESNSGGQQVATPPSPAGEGRAGQQSVETERAEPQVRKDGGRETVSGVQSERSLQSADDSPGGGVNDIQRQRVQIVEHVETFLGSDERDYDLEPNDVVSLPSTNADILLERGVARKL